METGLSKNLFIRRLAETGRVILLGGMAVIAYGRSRHTKDFDIWLEPFASCEAWAERLSEVLAEFPDAFAWSLAERRQLSPSELADEIATYGVLRIGGFPLPVDVFRKPNEFSPEDFDMVWKAARTVEHNVALPDELHLYVTKINTGRQHDLDDIAFLESLVKARFKERLPICDLAEATTMLDRFLDPEALQHARTNPHPEVRALALKYLREFEAEGDPYSRDILAAGGWED
jgi:hypothetical protein